MNACNLADPQRGNSAHPNGPVRVLLIDDFRIHREVLRISLECYENIVVIGEASRGAEGVQLAIKHRPHVAVVDVEMPNLDGPGTVRILREKAPETKTIGYSIHDDRETRDLMLKAGADAYLPKAGGTRELVRLIRGLVSSGDQSGRPTAYPGSAGQKKTKSNALSAEHEAS